MITTDLLATLRDHGGFTFNPADDALINIGDLAAYAIAVPGTELIIPGTATREQFAESVAATLAFAGRGRRVVPIALPDEFLAAGALPTLHDRYGLSTDAVVSTVRTEYHRDRVPSRSEHTWRPDTDVPTL